MAKLDTDEFLHPAEVEAIPDAYRAYHGTKRNNFVASITNEPELWKLYLAVDAVFYRGIEQMRGGHARPIQVFPLTLYTVVHAKMRVAMDLGFSGCYQEMRSILRDGLETAAFAHYMLGSPELQAAWRDKYDNDAASRFYRKHFEHNKRETLWKGIETLYDQYGQLSEMGSHPTLRSFYNRVVFAAVDGESWSTVNYTGGASERTWVPEVLSMVMIRSQIEDLFFSDFESRLRLDHVFIDMRKTLHDRGQWVKRSIVERYGIQPQITATP